MRLNRASTFTMALALLIPSFIYAHAQGDADRPVAGGGISVPGWEGKIDASAERAGQTVNNAKLAPEGKALHVTTGPAVTYWNPANKATGDYAVTATFNEPKFMNLNDHPHPYGIVIAGNDMGTAQQSYLYCAAYGDGKFIVRGFGPQPFQMNGRRASPTPPCTKRREWDNPSRSRSRCPLKAAGSNARSTAPLSPVTTRRTW